jgi:uncharacterized protein
MFPMTLTAGTLGYALVFGVIGFGFGAAMEMGGFGDTRKLAAQFYFKDLTVLKVMFTGILVAAVLVAGATSLGLLDMSRVWVNPTYLWPSIVGGLVMGVGFILGGFCPGTSVVAASTLKVDGMLFLAGVIVGTGLFGETVGRFERFFLSSDMGRFTLPELFGLPLGVTLVLVVAMALAMFWGAELLEQRYGQGRPWSEIALAPRSLAKVGAAGLLASLALLVALLGQPGPGEKFALLGAAARRPVEERAMFVHPAEVVALRNDLNVEVVVLDLRDEHDFNLFHLGGARRVAPEALFRPETVKRLLDQPGTTVTFLAGNGEAAALAAWKGLTAMGVANLYVIEGGMNGWLEKYAAPACVAQPPSAPTTAAAQEGEELRFRFAYATGASLPAAWPELPHSRAFRSPCADAVVDVARATEEKAWPAYTFAKKVKLQSRVAAKGGCG